MACMHEAVSRAHMNGTGKQIEGDWSGEEEIWEDGKLTE